MAPASRRANSSLPAGYVEDQSRGPMLRFQDSLPRLPVPTLEETAARYLKSLHPLLSPSEFAHSKSAVGDFVQPGGVGARLQEKLLARRDDPKHKNWIYDWWNEAAYLAYRDPVVPYVSYFYSHRDDRRRRDPVKRAAAISTAVLSFKKQVDEGTLEPEYMKKLPMCMDSYRWMFNASRVAAKPADYPVKFDAKAHKHLVAIRKNNIYKVLHEVDGEQLGTAELEAQFKRVYELASSRGPAVGALTSQNRDIAADARAMLFDAGNKAAVETVESASFVVCLDDAAPVTLEERAHAYWHGDGQNRWYDKPLQFIINDNGTSGFMGEHSMMDGTPTHRLNDFVNTVLVNDSIDLGPAAAVRSHVPEPALVRFNVTADLHREIDRAIRDFKTVIGQHELAVCAFASYGKGLIKQFQCSPDAFVQMIIQLAYYKRFGQSRPTYESAATRRFQQGRTETCRTVSDASVAWCRAMEDLNAADHTKIALFHKAIAAHLAYISAASDGKGCDRHLFGLKKLLGPGDEVPAIFKDPAYSYSSSWHLSTSQLSSEHFNGYGWSQVIDQGFGIAYMINENTIHFNIVSKGLGSQAMSFYLDDAAGDMRDLLLPTLQAPKSKL